MTHSSKDKKKFNVYYISNNNDMFFWNTSREKVFSWHIKPRPANLLTRSEMHMISEVNCADSAVSTIDVEMLRSWVDFSWIARVQQSVFQHIRLSVSDPAAVQTQTPQNQMCSRHTAAECVCHKQTAVHVTDWWCHDAVKRLWGWWWWDHGSD